MKTTIKKPDLLPLYQQVRTALTAKIESGAWRPGEALPSEFALAGELGVSQGTVRKALDSLTRDQLVVRRQGRGTFVAEHTPSDVLFRYFKLYKKNGERVLPSSRDVRVKRGKGTNRECGMLNLTAKTAVIRISRTRLANAAPIIREFIVLPEAMFPNLGVDEKVPNTLYDLFQHQYGITVARADERIEPVAAGIRHAQNLNIEAGAPILKIDRITYGLGDHPIEWRVSMCHLKGLHYLAELR